MNGRAGFLAVLLLVPAPGGADTAREILDAVIAANRAREPKDVTQRLRMVHSVEDRVLFRREMLTRTRFYGDDTQKTLTLFLGPADIQDVAFLGWHDPGREDAQWLYLPKIRRVRVIGPQARQRSFQGSVFTYEDLELFEEMLDWTDVDAESRIVEREALLEDTPCAVIDLVPRGERVLAYGRFRVWIHRPDATLRRVDLFRREDGELFKRSRFSEWKVVERIPVAFRTELVDVQDEIRTVLETDEITFNQGLDEGIFTPGYLDHAAP